MDQPAPDRQDKQPHRLQRQPAKKPRPLRHAPLPVLGQTGFNFEPTEESKEANDA
jgi:hypothetical protein